MGCSVIGRGYYKWGYQYKQWEIEWDGTVLTIKNGFVWGQIRDNLSNTHKTKYELGPSHLGSAILNAGISMNLTNDSHSHNSMGSVC